MYSIYTDQWPFSQAVSRVLRPIKIQLNRLVGRSSIDAFSCVLDPGMHFEIIQFAGLMLTSPCLFGMYRSIAKLVMYTYGILLAKKWTEWSTLWIYYVSKLSCAQLCPIPYKYLCAQLVKIWMLRVMAKWCLVSAIVCLQLSLTTVKVHFCLVSTSLISVSSRRTPGWMKRIMVDFIAPKNCEFKMSGLK